MISINAAMSNASRITMSLLIAAMASSIMVGQTVNPARGDQDRENRILLPVYEGTELSRKRPESRTDRRFQLWQITDDFRHLQLLNNQVREDAAHQNADYTKLIKPLGEIRKRAKRLRTNLALPAIDVEKESPGPQSDVALESLLSNLDQSVLSFVRNPMFRSTKVVDVGLAKTGRADIDRVIELSEVITKRIRK